MTTTAVDIAGSLAQALVADRALNNWCKASYGREVAVRMGVDPGDQPRRVAECPFVVVLPDREQRDLPRGEHTMRLRVVLGVEDENLVEQQGVRELQGFVRLGKGMWPAVWRVLADGLDSGPGNPTIDAVDMYYEVAEFPLQMLVADVTIKRLLPIGGRRG